MPNLKTTGIILLGRGSSDPMAKANGDVTKIEPLVGHLTHFTAGFRSSKKAQVVRRRLYGSITMFYYYASVLVLAGLLFFPVSKLTWVLSVRRLERRLKRETSASERQGQLARARFLAVFAVLIFSLLFNYHLLMT